MRCTVYAAFTLVLTDFVLNYRFLEVLTAKRRQAQEKLAEKALEDAMTMQEEEAKAAAEAAAANGPKSISAPATPATTPTGIREGKTPLSVTVCRPKSFLHTKFIHSISFKNPIITSYKGPTLFLKCEIINLQTLHVGCGPQCWCH